MDTSRETQLFIIDLKQGRREPLLASFSNIMIRMGSYFHHWVNHNGVTVSIELLEWGRTEFWCKKTILSGIWKWDDSWLKDDGQWLSWDHEKNTWPKVTKMVSINGPRIGYNGLGVLRGQRQDLLQVDLISFSASEARCFAAKREVPRPITLGEGLF